MQKTFLPFVCLSLLITLAAACGQGVRAELPDDSPYCEDSAMAHFLTEPERALTLLDSAASLGSISPQRAEYLKAIVHYNGLDDGEGCINLCQQLINRKAWRDLPEEEDPVSFEVDLYRLMATAATSQGNPMAVIRYAREGIKLAHGNPKLLGDEADLLSRMGFMMCQQGQSAEGIETLRRAEELSLGDDSWSALLSYLNNAKKCYSSLVDLQRYSEASSVILAAISHLESVCQRPQSVRNIPEAMKTDSAALNEFADYYRVSFYSSMARLCSLEGLNEEASNWIGRYEEVFTRAEVPPVSDIIHPLILLGRYSEAKQQIEIQKQTEEYEGCTLHHLAMLREELFFSDRMGNESQSLDLTRQIIELSDSLNRNSYRQMLAEASVEFQLQDEKLRHEDREAYLLWVLDIVLVILLLASILGGVFFSRRLLSRHRKLQTELHKANSQIEELKKQPKEEKTKSVTVEEIYRRALFVMEQYHPFTCSDYDISDLAQAVFSNRTYVSAAINTMTGTNFRTWLNKYRVEYAMKLMRDNPQLKMEELASLCGADSRVNLHRIFKAYCGMTPSEWMAQQ